ncbi:unnamed protein product [Dovyalis caffra]|uniref:Pectinesterase inhibitor domain-containing protein n=1 Tax=Dovyalis caffra TaxID=77055 RepID=A0AAV1SLW7_9ROSI|nr:unnamed protein product [Dovyalis caffra]
MLKDLHKILLQKSFLVLISRPIIGNSALLSGEGYDSFEKMGREKGALLNAMLANATNDVRASVRATTIDVETCENGFKNNIPG